MPKEKLKNQLMTQQVYCAMRGFIHPAKFLDSNFQNLYLNPAAIHEAPFIQVLHVYNHWVTVTNYNPFYDQYHSLGVWFVYDSLNNPKFYIPYLKPAMKRLNMDSNSITILICHVQPQFRVRSYLFHWWNFFLQLIKIILSNKKLATWKIIHNCFPIPEFFYS